MEKIDTFSEPKRKPSKTAENKLSGIEHGASLEMKRALKKTIKNSDARAVFDKPEIFRITEQMKEAVRRAWREGENKTKKG